MFIVLHIIIQIGRGVVCAHVTGREKRLFIWHVNSFCFSEHLWCSNHNKKVKDFLLFVRYICINIHVTQKHHLIIKIMFMRDTRENVDLGQPGWAEEGLFTCCGGCVCPLPCFSCLALPHPSLPCRAGQVLRRRGANSRLGEGGGEGQNKVMPWGGLVKPWWLEGSQSHLGLTRALCVALKDWSALSVTYNNYVRGLRHMTPLLLGICERLNLFLWVLLNRCREVRSCKVSLVNSCGQGS